MTHLKSELAEKQEIIKQFIQKEGMSVDDLPLDPRVDAYVTNNFLQGTLSRLLAFSDTKGKYIVVKVDADGNLKTTASVTNNIFGRRNGAAQAISANILGGMFIDPSGRDLTVDIVVNNKSVPGSGNITHAGIDLQHAAKITCLVSTNAACTVRVQFSDDNLNWYEFVDETDTARTYSVNNQKKAFRIDNAAKFLRLFITNDTTADVTVHAVVMGQA